MCHICGRKIGGVPITTRQLDEFFHWSYAESDEEWRDNVTEARQHSKWSSRHFMLQIISSDPIKDTVTLLKYEIDGIHKYTMTGQLLRSGKKMSSLSAGTVITNPSIIEHSNYHLAHFFQCKQMLVRYEKQALITAEAIFIAGKSRLQLWRLLLLADRYDWTIHWFISLLFGYITHLHYSCTISLYHIFICISVYLHLYINQMFILLAY
jgi:hypothetical protein